MTAARILVVDDEADINMILSVTLRRAGYEVTSAADGLEAVEAVHRQTPDLILLDVMMPRADGLEALRRIREHGPTAQVPVIMLTAKTALADKMTGFERGADDYVAKPFEPAEIVARVQALLRRTAQSRVVSPLLGVLGDWFTTERVAQLGRDLEAARDIQQRLLPPVPASLAGLEAGAALRSSTVVGGDFFDVIPMGERLGVAVGDVSGKGIPAALLMVMVRTLLREIARSLVEPAEVLTWLNASLCRDMPPSMFVTLVLAVLDPAEPGRVRLASAGHPDAVVVRAAGRAAIAGVAGIGGTVLGVFDDSDFEQTTLELGDPGDTLLLLTDGIVEAQEEAGRRPGIDALLPLLERERGLPPASLAQAVCDDVRRRGGSRVQDDMTVFVLRRPRPS
ncbi:MAG TPA: SpoIIE family protein phosphatase [Methylomirabilota bacterium]|nr:SpoIIE family protein phosphatase [Methylomirabilota bacterium]